MAVVFNQNQTEEITILLNKYPITYPPTIKKYSYGTAGFRYNAKYLPCIFIRMGIFAAIRSASLKGESVGVMCTASHNPKDDNGIKCIDSNGDMLQSSLEVFVEELVNAPTPMEFIQILTIFLNQLDIYDLSNTEMTAHFGHDTRSHSSYLTDLAIQGANTVIGTKQQVIHHGYVTTPQLHYIVLHSNPKYLKLTNIIPNPDEKGYWYTLCNSYIQLLQTRMKTAPSNHIKNNDIIATTAKQREWYIDCACGVGYNKVSKLNEYLSNHISDNKNNSNNYIPKFIACNSSKKPYLNECCGADYVQKNQSLPKFYEQESIDTSLKGKKQYASFDGDADRIVFYYLANNNSNKTSFHLLDGDKIAIFIAKYFKEEILHPLQTLIAAENLSVGIVQTAYANGASTKFIKESLKMNVQLSKTGVKYLHKTCVKYFDIGIYFESNGHGTVLFSTKFYQFLEKCTTSDKLFTVEQQVALQKLSILPSFINQAVGDALSNLLFIDAVIYLYGWDGNGDGLKLWNDALYVDLPSRQLKVVVPDRSIIQTNENESKVLHPKELQSQLDLLMEDMDKNTKGCRCFVRPSGTENIVRVYAEASTQEDADLLADKTATIVKNVCNDYFDVSRNNNNNSKL